MPALLAAALLLSSPLLSFSSQTQSYAPLSSPSGSGAATWSLAGRRERYCADPPFGAHDEGRPPQLGYELIHATVLVRHGDRSNIGRLPGTLRETFECGEPTAAAVARYARELALFRSSGPCLLAGGSGPLCEGIEGVDLGVSSDSARFSWGLEKAAGAACSVGGELSSVGWRQLRGVGLALGRAYRGLILAGGPASAPLQAISTDTGRTALSAASLLGGVLEALVPGWSSGGEGGEGGANQTSSSNPPLASASLTQLGDAALAPPPPTVGRSAAAAGGEAVAPAPLRSLSALFSQCRASGLQSSPLPGLHLPLPLHILPRELDPMLWPKKAHVCPAAAVEQGAQEEDIFQHQVLPEDVSARIAAVAGVSEDALPTTEECADDLITRACHSHPLPCWNATCLSQQDASSILAQCDAGYAHRFNNRITNILTFPLLQQLMHTLQRAAVREVGVRGGAGSSAGAAPADGGTVPRLALRSVHDTVLAPLLTVLGAAEAPYAWPNYASRVALELWAPPPPAATGEAAAAAAAAAAAPHSSFLVSLLYNGVDITQRLECAQVLGGSSSGSGSGSGSGRALCTLEALQAQVARLIQPHASWEEACATDATPPPAELHPPTGKKRRQKAHAPSSDVGCGEGETVKA